MSILTSVLRTSASRSGEICRSNGKMERQDRAERGLNHKIFIFLKNKHPLRCFLNKNFVIFYICIYFILFIMYGTEQNEEERVEWQLQSMELSR